MESMKIKFLFMANETGVGKTVEKADGEGVKHRYLYGISSGTKVDGHGERMTEECIKDFMAQADSGNILLYADKHGISSTDDIGILNKAEPTPDGDWMTEYRLYDTSDKVGPATLEKADKLWRQVNGFPPYKKPMQKGFSIEGMIPPEGIVQMDSEGRRVVNKVQLDGVVVVPRPAYKPSVAAAIYKSFGECLPSQIAKAVDRIKTSISESLELMQSRDDYFKAKFQVEDAFWREIDIIMSDTNVTEKQSGLENLFDEYKSLMVPILIKHVDVFTADDLTGQDLRMSKSTDKDPLTDLWTKIATELSKVLNELKSTQSNVGG